jgi:hypothetical protein
MHPHYLPPQTRLMRRGTHQLAHMRPVVPDVCPWPLRFQYCPTPAPGSVAGRTGTVHAEAADGACQPFRKIALTAVAGGDAAPNSYLHGCATAAIVSATAGRNPCTCSRQNRLICVRLLSEIRSDGLAGRCAHRVQPRGRPNGCCSRTCSSVSAGIATRRPANAVAYSPARG